LTVRAIRFVPDAWEAYLCWQDQDKKTLKRINLFSSVEPVKTAANSMLERDNG